jgi:homoserine kinase
MYKYYNKVLSNKSSISGRSVFPDFRLLLTQSNRNILQQQAQYEEAQENIEKTNEMIIRQKGEMDLLNEEYQTRFGGISRYG